MPNSTKQEEEEAKIRIRTKMYVFKTLFCIKMSHLKFTQKKKYLLKMRMVDHLALDHYPLLKPSLIRVLNNITIL